LVRLDLRDNMTQKYAASNGSQTHSFEAMIGVSVVLGRPQEAPAAVDIDTDRDGVVDRLDRCPTEAGVGTDGCPIRDRDGDGVADSKDKCPDIKGDPPDGCPLVKDSDGDGIPDDKDQCIEVKGDQPDGCPADKDSDGDGIVDSKDKCPNEAESFNGYEDTDGCPDELPTQVKDFTGILKGIEFDRDKATLSAASLAALDKSAQVLLDYPSLRVLITGHTDDTGGREKNLRLSKARAESVKAYYVSKGIDATRIETKGAGPDAPLDSNATAAGRQLNRRIELKLLKNSE
jgi:OOP family OmpA-OmpF porin